MIESTRFARLTEGAPMLDLGEPKSRATEARAVVENVMGSMIGSVRKELSDIAKFEKGKAKKPPRAPSADGYTKILLADLKARGWELREIGK